MKKLFFALLILSLGACHKTTNTYPTEEDMKAYLMVYFKDSDHSLHFALSPDGYSFTDINRGKHIIAGDSIAVQKGIRDPHIMRGPDNMFYMVMTDLHIYARREGKRSNEWERPRSEYGWGNNRGFVLMKSADLINWKHSRVNFDETFEGYDSIGCAWAPQTIWDEEKNLPMIYYSMRFKDKTTRMFYTYANTDFDILLNEPKQIIHYPGDKTNIDADITKVGNKYHMFYVPHDPQAGIKQAVSDKINKDYVYDPLWYDSEDVKCEAPNVWKRIGEDKWVLMYDIYGLRPANFGFRETTDFINFTNLGRFNEGPMKATNFKIPKHGSVIHLTKDEAENLSETWGLNMSFNQL